jgi:hypothetical protein
VDEPVNDAPAVGSDAEGARRRASFLRVMLLGMTLLFLVHFYVLGASIARFSTGIGR